MDLQTLKIWMRMEWVSPAWLRSVGAKLRKLPLTLRKICSVLVGLKHWPEFSRIIKIMFKIIFYPSLAIVSILLLLFMGLFIVVFIANWGHQRRTVEFFLPRVYLPKVFFLSEIDPKPKLSQKFKVFYDDTYFFDLEYLTPEILWHTDRQEDRDKKNKIITAIEGNGRIKASRNHRARQSSHLVRVLIHRILANGQIELCFSRSVVPSVNLSKSGGDRLLTRLAEIHLIPGYYELTVEALTPLMLPLPPRTRFIPSLNKFSILGSGSPGFIRAK